MERVKAVHETRHGSSCRGSEGSADTLSSRQRKTTRHDVDPRGRSGRVLASAQSIRVQTKRGTPAASRLNLCRRVVHPRVNPRPRAPSRVVHLTRHTAHETTDRRIRGQGALFYLFYILFRTPIFKNENYQI